MFTPTHLIETISTLPCCWCTKLLLGIIHFITVLVICTTSLRVVQLMYKPLRLFKTTLGPTLHYVHTLNVCHDALHDLSAMEGRFQTGIVNVHAHALNLNNEYITLLLVYKAAAWTNTLHMVLVICTTSFRVVQLMYRPLRVFKTTLGLTLCYVYTLKISVMDGRFH